jgi:uncharacterized membrane protein
MYVFDPFIGRRRRAIFRDKMIRLGHKTSDAVEVTSRDLKNRVLGVAAQARGCILKKEDVSDEQLEQRVRSKLGGWTSHPGSIEVRAEGGKVIVSGPILAHEVNHLLKRLASVRGVRSIENRLEPHERADSIPGLQGRGGWLKSGEQLDVTQANWSPTTRLFAGTLGAGVAVYGAKRLSGFGAALTGLGGALVARSLANMEFKRLFGFGAGRHAVHTQKIININAPVQRVFDFWANYENFPRFMTNVREVRDLGNHRSRWVVAGPAGVSVEWTAQVTDSAPNEKIAWKTVPGSRIQHAGRVLFAANPDGSTRLDIHITYNPVAGALGHAVAALFGADPKHQMDEDLARMKTMIETGVPPHDAAARGKEKGSYIH